MRIFSLLKRARSRPLSFLLWKVLTLFRSKFRTFLSTIGINPYKVAVFAKCSESIKINRRLAMFDQTLLLCSEEAFETSKIVAKYVDTLQTTAENAKLILQNEISILGYGRYDLGRVIDWGMDYKSKLRWLNGWHLEIDYLDLDRPSDVKFPWELSRLQFLSSMGRSYLQNRNEAFAEKYKSVVEDWDRKNPVGWNVNWSCPMDCSFRAISLIWSRTFFGSSETLDNIFWNRILRMLVEHGRFIYRNLEYSDINANHYTSNLLGLLYLGIVLPWYRESHKWKKFALRELEKEICRQTYSDGVVHEGSIAYHRLVSEMFLHAGLLCKKNDIDLSDIYWQRLEKMLDFVSAYSKPNGLAPVIGDNDNGRVIPLGEQDINDHRYLLTIGGIIFQREDMKISSGKLWEDAFWLLGPSVVEKWGNPKHQVESRNKAFPKGGFWFLRSDDNYVAIDCGDVGLRGRGGHGHNDTLSIALSMKGQDLIVDQGCHSYTSDRSRRKQNLSAFAHNAAIVNMQEPTSFDNWDFLCTTAYSCRVLMWDPSKFGGHFSGEHTGYYDRYGIRYVRDVTMVNGNQIAINDSFDGTGEHSLLWRWFFASSIDVKLAKTLSSLELIAGDQNFLFSWEDEKLSAQILNSEYYPEYGKTEPTKCLELSAMFQVPISVKFMVQSSK